ncbi:MAG: sodium-dependent bicarbonate transport family permease [Chloroherpetonaceae bacterium]|nr:sodium-dependent bicarbonate transport family permease [Chloroherpetonaceae bacterium]MDW8437374.1 sodium-dependent bicarbonate transport family permease [Chloroherpetonaceae bacterium]
MPNQSSAIKPMDFQAILSNLLSPMILGFLLGVTATLLKSDLKFPEELYLSLTIYLLIAIGLKGGYKLSLVPFSAVYKPLGMAILIGSLIPVWSFFILRRLGKFDVPNAAAIAAHYGSVSAATFSATLAFLDEHETSYEGFMPGLLAVLEVPAILIAIFLAKSLDRSGKTGSLREVMRELLTSKSTILLVGCLAIGLLAGKSGWEQVAPFFDAPFRGVLMLFLLEAGLVTGRRLSDLKRVGFFLIGFGIAMPILHAVLGLIVAKWSGLSMGGAMIFAALMASASYIAAPAACRVALPQASPTYYLTASLAVTFPFNIIFGLPIYYELAEWLYNH